jgi:hypothetical protein
MPDDIGASAATDSATQDQGQGQGQDPTTGAAAAAAGDAGDGRSPEQMLTDAITTTDDGGDSGDGGDGGGDAAVKRLEKQLADLKRHSRTWETRAKENSAAAAKLRELEDANKTEVQRATDRAVQAEKTAADAQALYHRTLACARYDLPPGLIDQVHGGTEDEINASAEALAAAINERAAVLAAAQAKTTGTTPQNGFRGPVESLRPGALPASDNTPRDPNAWFRELLSAKRQ